MPAFFSRFLNTLLDCCPTQRLTKKGCSTRCWPLKTRRMRVEKDSMPRPVGWRTSSTKAITIGNIAGKTILDAPDGRRLFYHPSLNAGTIAVQFALAQFADGEAWTAGIGESGLRETYRRLFGDPFEGAFETVPSDLRQPELTLPFPRGDVWRFTGGFHGRLGKRQRLVSSGLCAAR